MGLQGEVRERTARQTMLSVMIGGMFHYEPSADELLLAWADANRAAELAERLARVAFEASDALGTSAAESEALAALAEHAASAANEAAMTARRGARRAHDAATRGLHTGSVDADREAERLAGRPL